MRVFALIVAVILFPCLFCLSAQAGPVRGAAKTAAHAVKIVKVVKVVRPLKLVKAVLPPFRGK